MRTILTLCACCLICPALSAGEPALTVAERAQAVQLLRDSQKEFLESVQNLSDTQWNYKSAPDRWSVGEVAEHIMLSESLLFGTVQRALAADANPDWEAKTAGKAELLERALLDRSHKAQAPEPLRPQGIPRDEIIRRYKEARARTLKLAEETQLPLKAHTVEHPFPLFNTLNAYQWLIYIPLHNLRHNQQIAEVKASSGFPN